MEDIRDKVLNSKWFVLVLVLALGIMVLSVMAKVINTTTYKKNKTSDIVSKLAMNTKFVNGFSWRELSNMNIPEMDQALFKIYLLRIYFETSFINGKPLIQSTGSLVDYVKYIDTMYGDPKNANVPLFYAIKMADMAKNGYPAGVVESYKARVMRKLQQMGLL